MSERFADARLLEHVAVIAGKNVLDQNTAAAPYILQTCLNLFPALMNKVNVIPIPPMNTPARALASIFVSLLTYNTLYATLLTNQPQLNPFNQPVSSLAVLPAHTAAAKSQ